MKSIIRTLVIALLPCWAVAAGPDFSASLATPKGMTAEDGSARIHLRLFSWEPGAKSYQLRQRLTGWDGQEIKSWPAEDFRFEGEWKRQVDLKLLNYGSCRYVAEIRDGDTLVAEASRRVTWVAPTPERSPESRWDAFIGINSHQWADWKFFNRLGIYWARDYSWQWYGKGEKGVSVPQGENFQNRLAAARESGVNTLPCIQKTFVTADKRKWMESPEEITAIFRRISDHFPEQKVFQIGNEEEANFPDHVHDAANYANFITHAAKGFEAAGHGARVILSGDVFMHDEVMVKLLDSPARDAFKAACIHVYTGTVPPEIATRDANAGSEKRAAGAMVLDRVREYAARLKAAGKETWMTETGWDVTYGPAVGERLQAVYLPRMFLLTRWAGVDKTFWFFDLDGKGKNRFDSSGLIDLDGSLRPSGATLAALSRLALGAERAGSLYLGSSDIWAPVWKMPDGRWLVTAWAVKDAHPVPSSFARAREAYDMFANKIPPAEGRITDEVRYHFFDALPQELEAQRLVELHSRRLESTAVGGKFSVSITTGPGKMDMKFTDVPMVFSPGPSVQGQGIATSMVKVTNDAAPGRYELGVRASGEGWEKRWTIEVHVLPPVDVAAEPYSAGGSTWVELRRADGSLLDGRIAVDKSFGTLEPLTLTAAAGEAAKVRFNASPEASGPVPLAIDLADGIKQTVLLRPLALALPRAGKIDIDGDFADWPSGSMLPPAIFATSKQDFQVSSAMSWSPDGLYIAAKIPVEKVFSSDPEWFWSYQNLEVFLKPSREAGDNWTPDCRQFFMVPVEKGGAWRLVAGEWRKSADAKAENVFDDPRIKTAMRHEKDFLNMEAFIPAAAIGSAPSGGSVWRGAIAMQTGTPGQMDVKACWPRPKSDGILDRPSTWGLLKFK